MKAFGFYLSFCICFFDFFNRLTREYQIFRKMSTVDKYYTPIIRSTPLNKSESIAK